MTAGPGLLVIGEVVTDIVARHTGPLAPDTDTPARIAVRPGGAGANAAAWAAHCGADVALLARVGADDAAWHRTALLADGVRPRLRTDHRLPTAVVIALVDTAAERTLVTDSGAAVHLGPDDWDDQLLDGVGHLHLSGYLLFTATGRRLAALAMSRARERGATVSVDPASTGFMTRTGVTVLRDATRGADLLLPNAAEAQLLTGNPEPADAARKLSEDHRTVVVTLGAQGALVARRGAPAVRIPAVPSDAVDTTGAGDAFTGGFLAALLRGAEPAEAAAAGCRTGAQAVATVGARPPGRLPGEQSDALGHWTLGPT
ncbi:carbohydrate kinase family protein [Streptantibioticus ferralitis]|uniref:PfkB family carbohydrate kinase n=1 Tax=Streptantibioticus ferralitis TaxID=236510 RepID=A0ABT5YWQ3_9ACTN|nr:PfkB family carbohydrate kinase [Streptantibioticus ferralitis]MDF2255827.1 PfkB family carbohydrate kinase [Streptantibioticus ferralitis]